MRTTVALTAERKAIMAAEIADWPPTATYYRCDGDMLKNGVSKAVRTTTKTIARIIYEFFNTWFLRGLAVFVAAIQLPFVAAAIQTADSKVAEDRAALSFHVAGNTATGVETMTHYLRARGFSIASDETRADRTVVVHKVQFTPHDCRDNTMIRLQVKVMMPNGLPLQPFKTYPRYRYLSCDKGSYTDHAGQFIKDIMADLTPRFDSYFLSEE